jgi:hypothetical protein
MKPWRFGPRALMVLEMKILSRIAILASALSMVGGFAFADSSQHRNDDPSYALPTIVHGKTSMRNAMKPNSTFSFKMFQTGDDGKPQKPYSYPEPDDNHR